MVSLPMVIHGMSLAVEAGIACTEESAESDGAVLHLGTSEIPRICASGVEFTLIAGASDGLISPVTAATDLVCAEIVLTSGASYQIRPEHRERAIDVVGGDVEISGRAGLLGHATLVMREPGGDHPLNDCAILVPADAGRQPLTGHRRRCARGRLFLSQAARHRVGFAGIPKRPDPHGQGLQGLVDRGSGAGPVHRAAPFPRGRPPGSLGADEGWPLGIKPDTLVVPSSLEGAALRLLNNGTRVVAVGETPVAIQNEWAGTAKPIVSAWL